MAEPDIPVCTKTFTLHNGQRFPAVGLGTWQGGFGSEDAAALEASLVHALRSGYRMIDTAQYYGVEAVVGRAVRHSGVPRSAITVVTKFWGCWHHDPAAALQISLASLGLAYVDVFLMHWPWAQTPPPACRPLRIDESPTFVETWRRMEPLVGPTCRAIGVSNFTPKLLDVLLAECTVVPAVNQVELHALNPNWTLVPYCQARGIQVVSWSTLGGDRRKDDNPILTHDLFRTIAAHHGCSTGCVSLSWAVQRGVAVIPKSSAPRRIEENIRLVTLTADEMATVGRAADVIGRRRLSDIIDAMYVTIDGQRLLGGWSVVDFGWEDEQGNWLV